MFNRFVKQNGWRNLLYLTICPSYIEWKIFDFLGSRLFFLSLSLIQIQSFYDHLKQNIFSNFFYRQQLVRRWHQQRNCCWQFRSMCLGTICHQNKCLVGCVWGNVYDFVGWRNHQKSESGRRSTGTDGYGPWNGPTDDGLERWSKKNRWSILTVMM